MARRKVNKSWIDNTVKPSPHTTGNKLISREEVNSAVDEYLKNGGKIKKVVLLPDIFDFTNLRDSRFDVDDFLNGI